MLKLLLMDCPDRTAFAMTCLAMFALSAWAIREIAEARSPAVRARHILDAVNADD
jgi:hypothetical protein